MHSFSCEHHKRHFIRQSHCIMIIKLNLESLMLNITCMTFMTSAFSGGIFLVKSLSVKMRAQIVVADYCVTNDHYALNLPVTK